MVQLDHVEVVAVGVQRGNIQLGALPAVILMVVVGADVGDTLGAQQLDQAAGDRRFAGGAVADNPQDDRSLTLYCPQ